MIIRLTTTQIGWLAPKQCLDDIRFGNQLNWIEAVTFFENEQTGSATLLHALRYLRGAVIVS